MATLIAAATKPQRNYRSQAFRAAFEKLPPQTQDLSRRKFELFVENPTHPGFKRGSVQNAGRPAFVVWVDYSHRAVYRLGGLPSDETVSVWEWIGTAEEFQTLYMSGRGPSSAPMPPHRPLKPTQRSASTKRPRKQRLSTRQRREERVRQVVARHPEILVRAETLVVKPEPMMPETNMSTTVTSATNPQPEPAAPPPPPPPPPARPASSSKEWTPNRLAGTRVDLMSLFDLMSKLLMDYPRTEKELLDAMEQVMTAEATKKRLQAEIDQGKKNRTALEGRMQGCDARIMWLEAELAKTSVASTAERQLRKGVEEEVQALRDDLLKSEAMHGSLQRRIEAAEGEKAMLARSATANLERVRALEAEATNLRASAEKTAKAVQNAQPVFQPSGKIFLISDFNPEQVPISGCTFRVRPITKDKVEAMLTGAKFDSGLAPRIAPLIGRALGMTVERGRRPDLRPGDECILVSWQSRNAPRDSYMNENEFSVWAQWLRWDHVQILRAA